MAKPDHTGAVEARARAIQAQPTTFEEIYEEHVERIWRFIERLGVPDRHLDDATQDTFVIAHRQLKAFRRESSVSTWLHGIALRVAKDYRRREERKGGWQELSPEAREDSATPFERAASREQLDVVLKLLQHLDDTQREVFVLVELQGLTAPEVAELTETNVNTVSTRLRAARLRFNELVSAAGVLR
ncbi:MAG: RNA polymerase sigma factor [Myxococcaceae bacterium]|nr:RNA polymerase sigma factor [Myxococcaceae bacterium]